MTDQQGMGETDPDPRDSKRASREVWRMCAERIGQALADAIDETGDLPRKVKIVGIWNDPVDQHDMSKGRRYRVDVEVKVPLCA